jgi:hypothetical protein
MTINLTDREAEFVTRATYEKNCNSVGEMIEDYGYTAQECGGFISSLIKKGFCTEWNEPEAMKGYRAQFGITDEVIEFINA